MNWDPDCVFGDQGPIHSTSFEWIILGPIQGPYPLLTRIFFGVRVSALGTKTVSRPLAKVA